VSEESLPPEGPQAPEGPQTTAPPSDPPRPAPRRAALAAILPHAATALAAVLISLLVQALLLPAQPAPAATPTAVPTALAPEATGTPEPPAATAPPATPAPTPALGADSVLGLQILDLQQENRELRSALYLLRAASQVNDVILALEGNDLAEADRTLLAVYRSLDLAYNFSAEQEKGPIDSFRLELSRIRDDLRVRPDGIDRRLRQLRGLILSLVDEAA
jgi:hypothetical protein